MEKRSILNNQKRSHSSLMRVASSNIFWETLNHPKKKKEVSKSLWAVLALQKREQTDKVSAVRAETRHRSPKVRSELGDWSLISNLSLWQWKKKKKHKVALSRRSVWYAAAGPPSSETRRRLKAETSKVASVHLHLPPRPPGGHTRPCSAWGAIRAFQWCPRITVTPSIRTHYMLYLEKKKFYVTTGTRPRSESFLSACQTRYRNFSLGISGEVFLSSSCGYSACHACWL